MSDLLIRGMELPVFEHQSWDIRKGADGKWYVVDTNAETSDGEWHEIVPVPPHGRLVDVGKVLDELAHNLGIRSLDYLTPSERAIVSWFRDAPTIIPAEEGET